MSTFIRFALMCLVSPLANGTGHQQDGRKLQFSLRRSDFSPRSLKLKVEQYTDIPPSEQYLYLDRRAVLSDDDCAYILQEYPTSAESVPLTLWLNAPPPGEDDACASPTSSAAEEVSLDPVAHADVNSEEGGHVATEERATHEESVNSLDRSREQQDISTNAMQSSEAAVGSVESASPEAPEARPERLPAAEPSQNSRGEPTPPKPVTKNASSPTHKAAKDKAEVDSLRREIENLSGLLLEQQKHMNALHASSVDETISGFDRAQACVRELGDQFDIPNLRLDGETHSCAIAVGEESDVTLYVTFDDVRGALFLYAPVLQHVPGDRELKSVMFEHFLRGGFLGRDFFGGGIGLSTENDVILAHYTLYVRYTHANFLRFFAPHFVKHVLEARTALKELTLAYNEHVLASQLKLQSEAQAQFDAYNREFYLSEGIQRDKYQCPEIQLPLTQRHDDVPISPNALNNDSVPDETVLTEHVTANHAPHVDASVPSMGSPSNSVLKTFSPAIPTDAATAPREHRDVSPSGKGVATTQETKEECSQPKPAITPGQSTSTRTSATSSSIPLVTACATATPPISVDTLLPGRSEYDLLSTAELVAAIRGCSALKLPADFDVSGSARALTKDGGGFVTIKKLRSLFCN